MLYKLGKIQTQFKTNTIVSFINRVASGPGISGNLEKSGNSIALEKSQGNVKEFLFGSESVLLLIKLYFTYAVMRFFNLNLALFIDFIFLKSFYFVINA